MTMHVEDKDAARMRRKRRVRKRVEGTPERPRMNVYKSNKHIYVQVIDDDRGQTLAAASTLSPEIRGSLEGLDKTGAARKVGELAASRCLERRIERVVFDRNGYPYHGRVAAVADAAREGGLDF